MANRFEQVDELQADALNLVLTQTAEGQNGRVLIPSSAFEEEGRKDIDSGEMPIVDAFRSAIQLGNELKLPVVVIDHDRVWRESWGELYREA